MTNKYIMLPSTCEPTRGSFLFRIQAIRDFSDVKEGDMGGYVDPNAEGKNLSHEGDCWIYDDAKVFEGASVSGNAKMYGNSYAAGGACVLGDVVISDKVQIDGSRVCIRDKAKMSGHARAYGAASVYEDAEMSGYAIARDRAEIGGGARINKTSDVFYLSHFARSDATLTAFVSTLGVSISHLGWITELEDFQKQTAQTSPPQRFFDEGTPTSYIEEYQALLTYLRVHFRDALQKEEGHGG